MITSDHQPFNFLKDFNVIAFSEFKLEAVKLEEIYIIRQIPNTLNELFIFTIIINNLGIYIN